MVCLRPPNCATDIVLPRQGSHRRFFLSPPAWDRYTHGRRLATGIRRGDPYEHLPQSCWLCDGAGANGKNCTVLEAMVTTIWDACQLGHFLLRRLKSIKPPQGMKLKRVERIAGWRRVPASRGAKPATELVLAVIKSMLHRGYILLPEGEHSM